MPDPALARAALPRPAPARAMPARAMPARVVPARPLPARVVPARAVSGLLALLCAALLVPLAVPLSAHAQASSTGERGATSVPIETRPEPIPDPEASAVKKPPPRSQRMQIKKTGEYVYKCGDEYTDNPVCQNTAKGAPLKPTAEEEQRCDLFNRGNFVPWYCRK